jgi:hypothetical protein
MFHPASSPTAPFTSANWAAALGIAPLPATDGVSVASTSFPLDFSSDGMALVMLLKTDCSSSTTEVARDPAEATKLWNSVGRSKETGTAVKRGLICALETAKRIAREIGPRYMSTL